MPDGSVPLAAAFHPYADLFPLLDGEEMADLIADIKANGLIHPIVELGNAIIDGRNRYRACIAADVKPRFVKFTGSDKEVLSYVISSNLKRRHMNESQRAMVAQKLETIEHGGDRSVKQEANLLLARSEAAKMLNVSPRSVQDAKKVRENGTPELVRRVESGGMAVSVAAKVAKMPAAKQREIAAEPDQAKVRGAVKKEARATRERSLASQSKAAAQALGIKIYGVICADPPWRFEPRSRDTGMDRAADNHYPTMTVDDICAIKPPAALDCALFLWATAPMLREALKVMDSWGFSYKSHFVWDKERIGTGYWVRNQHELLLIGTRGDIPAPAMGDQFASVIRARPTEHSAKPFIFLEMIESMFPNACLLEMFCRGPQRVGWDAWGNEAEASP